MGTSSSLSRAALSYAALGFMCLVGLVACEPAAEQSPVPADAAAVDVPGTDMAVPVAMAPMGADGFMIDATPRIAVATAFAPELDALLPMLEMPTEHRVNGVTFYSGQIAGLDVVVFKTGVSVVNASMNTQLVFDAFNITDIVVSGIAGGVDPDLSIGDVTVAREWAKYDEWVFMRETAPGVFTPPVGVEPSEPALGYMGPQGNVIGTAQMPEAKRQFWWPVDGELLAIAEVAAGIVEFERCSPQGQCLDEAPRVVLGGRGVTGSIFLDNAEVRTYLYDTFGAQVAEMETAAVAMVAHANDVPFIAFRSLSDLAGGGHADENEMFAFFHIAAQNSASLVVAFLEAYAVANPPSGDTPHATQLGAFQGCEINYSTMPLYSGGRLGADRVEKLKALHADPDAERAFISGLNDLTRRTVALVSDMDPETEFSIQPVWGGYLGTTSPSLAGRFGDGADKPAEREVAARIGASIGYVYLQDSVLVQCAAQSGEGGAVVPAIELSDVAGSDVLNADSLRSIYGMIIGEADGNLEVGFTYYVEDDVFSTLGFLDGGAIEQAAIAAVVDTLGDMVPGGGLMMTQRPRWVSFPANDWTTNTQGESYLAGAVPEELLDELNALQAEFIAAVDAL